MKTSLLLMGLMMGAGMVGTTQAATTTAATSIPNVPNPALVASSMSGNTVLSALGDIVSGKATTGKHAATATACGHDTVQPTDNKAKPCAPHATPGPGEVNPHAHAATGSIDSPRSANAGPALPSAASSAEAELGWQSLLPGSIQ